MPYKPRESDGLNLQSLIRELGDSPETGGQNVFYSNIVRALWNLKAGMVSAGLSEAQAQDLIDIAIGGETVPVLNQLFATRTASDSEQKGFVRCDLGSPIEILLPLDATDNLPIGWSATYFEVQASGLTIVGETGVTVNETEELGGGESTITGQGEGKAMTVIKVAPNQYDVIGGA